VEELKNEIRKLNKLMVIQLLQGKTQNECILLLNRVGFGQSEIANYLGTTPGTVNSAIIRAKKKSKK